MLNTKLPSLVLGVVVIVSAVYFLARETNPAGTVVVSVTDESFVPEEIKIQKGTKVIFRNDGQRLHWPASNFHPTHGIYPEFDPQQPIEPGGEWNFVFDKAGVWRYHDHLPPGFKGAISVIK